MGFYLQGFKIFVDLLLHPNNTGLHYNFDFGFGYWAADLDMNSKVKYMAPDDDQFQVLLNYYCIRSTTHSITTTTSLLSNCHNQSI